MTSIEVLAFIVVPLAGLGMAWGLVFYIEWADRRERASAPHER